MPKADPEAGPTVLITLLLTTGKRHPYKIDAKYLRKRNVTVEDNDPWNLPVQTLKELILRDWRDGELDCTLELEPGELRKYSPALLDFFLEMKKDWVAQLEDLFEEDMKVKKWLDFTVDDHKLKTLWIPLSPSIV